MRCPYCRANDDRVVDSRTSGDADVIRRRRECLECSGRFTTYERCGEVSLRVVKKDGSRVPFDREKLLQGILVACHKRPVQTEALESVVSDIETRLHEMFDKEVASKFIGHQVMEALRGIDQVAYVRFASVYREFKDVNQFLDELKPLLGGGEPGAESEPPSPDSGSGSERGPASGDTLALGGHSSTVGLPASAPALRAGDPHQPPVGHGLTAHSASDGAARAPQS